MRMNTHWWRFVLIKKQQNNKMSTHAHNGTITYGSNTKSEREDEGFDSRWGGKRGAYLLERNGSRRAVNGGHKKYQISDHFTFKESQHKHEADSRPRREDGPQNRVQPGERSCLRLNGVRNITDWLRKLQPWLLFALQKKSKKSVQKRRQQRDPSESALASEPAKKSDPILWVNTMDGGGGGHSR